MVMMMMQLGRQKVVEVVDQIVAEQIVVNQIVVDQIVAKQIVCIGQRSPFAVVMRLIGRSVARDRNDAG